MATLSSRWNSRGAWSYHTVDEDAEGDPEDEGKYHHGAHDVVSQELPWFGRVGGQKAGRSPSRSRPPSVRNSPKVLMSSLSMKSHNLSITSCTCFMHFPCWDGWVSGDDAEKDNTKTVLKRWDLNSRPRRRSPQCTASLCGGRGSCRRPGRMESRCRLSFCSTFCRSAPSLRMRSDDTDASAVFLRKC